MPYIKRIIIVLSLLQAFWMTFDGTRALIIGDYITPKSGPNAGRLGPWSGLVTSLGIEPRSTLMKSVFICYGLAWLTMVVFYVMGDGRVWWPMLALAVGTLWYLPVGTAISLLIAALTLVSIFLNKGQS
ncbi:MAG: hypothetical protein IPO77_17405 [Acidobacteria bacterium]|nr:hypothetical protein [Acidobacteriota bacterium]